MNCRSILGKAAAAALPVWPQDACRFKTVAPVSPAAARRKFRLDDFPDLLIV